MGQQENSLTNGDLLRFLTQKIQCEENPFEAKQNGFGVVKSYDNGVNNVDGNSHNIGDIGCKFAPPHHLVGN